MDNPFEIYVTDGRMQNRQAVGGVSAATFTPKFNGQGSGSISLPDSDPLNARLLADDARLIVCYRGEHLMSGKVRSPAGSILPGRDVTYEIQDDWRWLVNSLAWVNPTNPLMPTSLSATDQTKMGQAFLPGGASSAGSDGTITGQVGYYQFPSGAKMTETLVKNLIRTAFDRLNAYYAQFPQLAGWSPRAYSLAADQARGIDHVAKGDVPQVRFETLETYIVPLLTSGGLGLRLAQPLTGPIAIDTWVPKKWSQVLTVPSGAIVDGSWNVASPNATHAVVGGPGDLAARMFQQLSTPPAGNTSTLFSALDVIEVYKEASSGQITWPGTLSDVYKVEKYAPLRADVAASSYADALTTMASALADAMSDGAETSGVNVSLSETDTFHYGGSDGVHLGDSVTISSGDDRALKFTDQITECTLDLSQDKGLVVTPVVGEKKLSGNARFARAIVRLARTLHARSAAQ